MNPFKKFYGWATGRKDPQASSGEPRSSPPSQVQPHPKYSRPAEAILGFCTCVKDGEPAIYKLPLQNAMENDTNRLYRYDVGSPRSNVFPLPEMVLMMVGATGAGKTTLINGMANYVLGVKWEDNFRFKVTTEEKDRSQAESQTVNITAYTFHSTEKPFLLTIIDTPGFGDTHGIERDKEIKDQIRQFFSGEHRGGINQIHGIGFVVQASLPRLTPTQEYIFNAVLSIFGKDIIDNIFLMTTFNDGSDPAVLEAVRKANIPYKESFQFNNVAIFSSTKTTGHSLTSMFWQMSCSSYKSFFDHFTMAEPKSLALTREVLKERQQLEALIPAVQDQVRIALDKMADIEEEKKVLKQHEADIIANENFTYTRTEHDVRKVPLQHGVHTTTCLKCNYTCHDNCAYANDDEKSECCVMKNEFCKVCPEKCHWKSHSNLPHRFEYFSKQVTATNYELKEKCEVAASGKIDVEATIERYESRLRDLEADVRSLIEDARVSVKRLDEIALRPNPLDELNYLDLLIQSEEEQQKPGFRDRVSQYRKFRKNAETLKKVASPDDPDEATRSLINQCNN
jgi:GTPase Era involved in 16S rRNA processing